MDYPELMRGFAAKYGVSDIDTANGAAALEIDGMTVGFIHAPETDESWSSRKSATRRRPPTARSAA